MVRHSAPNAATKIARVTDRMFSTAVRFLHFQIATREKNDADWKLKVRLELGKRKTGNIEFLSSTFLFTKEKVIGDAQTPRQ